MVQTKVFVPTVRPVIAVFGEEGVITLAPPATTVHNPVPIPGVFPFSDDDDEQMVESNPAFAIVGKGST
jgi:hypothetical protein